MGFAARSSRSRRVRRQPGGLRCPRTGCQQGSNKPRFGRHAGRCGESCRAGRSGPARPRGCRRHRPVAGGDVEIAIGAELKLAPIVIAEHRVLDPQHRSAGRRIDALIGGAKLVDDQISVLGLGVEDVEQAGLRVVGRKRRGQQPRLTARTNQRLDVEVGRGRTRGASLDLAGGLDDEDRVGVVGVGGNVVRGGERPDRLERYYRMTLSGSPPWREREVLREVARPATTVSFRKRFAVALCSTNGTGARTAFSRRIRRSSSAAGAIAKSSPRMRPGHLSGRGS